MRALLIFCGLTGSLLRAEEPPLVRVWYEDDQKQVQEVSGKILLTAVDGGMLIVSQGGALHNVTPAKLQQKNEPGGAFKPLTQDEMARQLTAEFGEKFTIVRTQHYVVASQAGQVYGEWCGLMFERLYKAFKEQWETPPPQLTEPEFPLVVVIFSNQTEFARYAGKELGVAALQSQGYYSVRTNRVMIYDLAGPSLGRPAKNMREILQKMQSVPANVVTTIHEATHQIAFNTGVHQRYADNPLWLTEGLAMYFEAPDLRSSTGWRTVGKVNEFRIKQVKDYFARRPAGSLMTLISQDTRLRTAESLPDGYAEAWALTYFLMKTRREQYAKYLAKISAKPRLIWDQPDQRVRDFQEAFGSDLQKLDEDFARFIKRLD